MDVDVDAPHFPLKAFQVLGEVEVVRPILLPTPPIPELEVQVPVSGPEVELAPPPVVEGVAVSEDAAELGQVGGSLGRERVLGFGFYFQINLIWESNDAVEIYIRYKLFIIFLSSASLLTTTEVGRQKKKPRIKLFMLSLPHTPLT